MPVYKKRPLLYLCLKCFSSSCWFLSGDGFSRSPEFPKWTGFPAEERPKAVSAADCLTADKLNTLRIQRRLAPRSVPGLNCRVNYLEETLEGDPCLCAKTKLWPSEKHIWQRWQIIKLITDHLSDKSPGRESCQKSVTKKELISTRFEEKCSLSLVCKVVFVIIFYISWNMSVWFKFCYSPNIPICTHIKYTSVLFLSFTNCLSDSRINLKRFLSCILI